MAKSISAEDYRLRNSFEAMRRQLLDERYADRLERSLSYWALDADRRLPLALLDYSVKDLLQMSFERLSATAGVGRKKLGSLIMLLQRVADDSVPAPTLPLPAPPSPPRGEEAVAAGVSAGACPGVGADFDPAQVSETMWEQWCETIHRHDLKRERLGRLAPSLLDLPTVIWNTPLADYASRSLREIRKRRTHGEKRVRVVLELFYSIHRLVANVGTHHRLSLRLMPRFVSPVDDWLAELAVRDTLPDEQEIRQSLALPLLNQIAVDGGPIVQKLAEGRLGIESTPQSVRQQARKLNVTRARVYQLLETCSKIMDVRWPEGRVALTFYSERFRLAGMEPHALRLFDSVRDLFYPHRSSLLFPADEPQLLTSLAEVEDEGPNAVRPLGEPTAYDVRSDMRESGGGVGESGSSAPLGRDSAIDEATLASSEQRGPFFSRSDAGAESLTAGSGASGPDDRGENSAAY